MASAAVSFSCPLPEDREYDVDNDVWLQRRPADGSVRLGITAPLAAFAGRFQRVTFRPLSGRVEAGRSVATAESVRFTGPVRSPVSGTLVGWNSRVSEIPRLLNDAPYDAGWIADIRPDPAPWPPSLLAGPAARAQYARRIEALRIRCLPASPDTELIEIGAECSAILARLDEVLAAQPAEGVVLLVTDDSTAPIEMVRWADRTGHTVLHRERDGNLWRFLVRREPDPRPRRR